MDMKELQQKLGVNRNKIYRLRDTLNMEFTLDDNKKVYITEEQYTLLHNELHGVVTEDVTPVRVQKKLLKRKITHEDTQEYSIHDAIEYLDKQGIQCILPFNGKDKVLLNDKEEIDREKLLKFHNEYLTTKGYKDKGYALTNAIKLLDSL